MFAILADLTKRQRQASTQGQKNIAHFKLHQLQLKAVSVTSALRQSMAQLDRATESFQTFNAIREVISEEGLSRGLVALITKDPASAKLFKTLPALERMDAITIRPSDKRVQAMLAEMDETAAIEALMVCDFIQGSVSHLEDLFGALKEQLRPLSDITADLTDALSDGRIPESALAEVSAHTLCADSAVKLIEGLTHVVIHLDTPSTGDDPDEWSLEKLVGFIAECCGATINERGCVVVDPSRLGEEFQPKDATLTEHGFTIDGLIALLHGVDNLASELVTLSEKHANLSAYLSQNAADLKGDQSGEEDEPAPAPVAPGTPPVKPVEPAAGTPGAPPVEPATELNDGPVVGGPIDPAGNKTVDSGIDAGAVPASEEDDEDTSVDDVRDTIHGYLSLLVVIIEHAICVIGDVLRLAESLQAHVTGDDYEANEPTPEEVEAGLSGAGEGIAPKKDDLRDRLLKMKCPSHRLGQLAQKYPDKMSPLVSKLEKLNALTKSGVSFFELLDTMHDAHYLYGTKDDTAAIAEFAKDLDSLTKYSQNTEKSK